MNNPILLRQVLRVQEFECKFQHATKKLCLQVFNTQTTCLTWHSNPVPRYQALSPRTSIIVGPEEDSPKLVYFLEDTFWKDEAHHEESQQAIQDSREENETTTREKHDLKPWLALKWIDLQSMLDLANCRLGTQRGSKVHCTSQQGCTCKHTPFATLQYFNILWLNHRTTEGPSAEAKYGHQELNGILVQRSLISLHISMVVTLGKCSLVRGQEESIQDTRLYFYNTRKPTKLQSQQVVPVTKSKGVQRNTFAAFCFCMSHTWRFMVDVYIMIVGQKTVCIVTEISQTYFTVLHFNNMSTNVGDYHNLTLQIGFTFKLNCETNMFSCQ